MNYAIILSGGIGSRMRTDGFPKQYIEVKGKPILIYTLEIFDRCSSVDKIIIVADSLWYEEIKSWLNDYNLNKKFISFATPGLSRQGSILNGLLCCVDSSDDISRDNVIIHDAVRPCVNSKLIDQCFIALDEYEGCMPVLSVTDTTYYSDDGKHIFDLLNRDKLFAGQSPEAFKLKPYYEANIEATAEEILNIRGSTEIAYKHGLNVCLIPGDYGNFKITMPTDLDRFKTVLEDKNESIST